jgi:hypothetical protein
MSSGVRTAIYEKLATDPELNDLLARSTVEGMEQQPAIYERWAAAGTPFPYINLTYQFGESGIHWVKRQGTLNVDIFTGNADSTENEAIAERIAELLDHAATDSEKDGLVRTFYLDETDLLEDTPDIIHWNVVYRVDHWRLRFIEHLNNREV